jgi:hypothetical protein
MGLMENGSDVLETDELDAVDEATPLRTRLE